VISLVTALRSVIVIRLVVFAIKKKQKPVTSSRDVMKNKNLLSSLRRKIKKHSYIVLYIVNAKNWLKVYHLPTNTKKCLGDFKKNAIATSLSVTEGTV